MSDLNPKDKRKHWRVALLSEQIRFSTPELGEQTAYMQDISNGGMFIKMKKPLKASQTIYVHFQLPNDKVPLLVVPAKVIRTVWTKSRKRHLNNTGVGIEFQFEGEMQRRVVEAYVTFLRNKQIIAVSKRIIEEYYGGVKSGSTLG